MCFHPQLKLHLQCSTLTIIITPQTKRILSQLGQSQPLTRPNCLWKQKNPIQNLTDLPELPPFDSFQQIVPPYNAWNWLPIFSELDTNTPIEIFKLCFSNGIMRQLLAITNLYPQQQLLGPEEEPQHCWQPVTAQELEFWQVSQIHVGLIGVPLERYWLKHGVYLPKDGLPPSAYLGQTPILEICLFFHVSPYISPTETTEG